MLAEGPISWSSKKQGAIALSSTEEEVVEGPMTHLYVGHVIKLDMLLPHVTH